MKFDVLAEGLQFPEGPIAMADGSVNLVEISEICAQGETDAAEGPALPARRRTPNVALQLTAFMPWFRRVCLYLDTKGAL